MNQDKPRIGVYVCMCGSNIAGTVDVPAVTEAAGRLKNVVVARYNKYTCAGPGQTGIQEDIKEYGLNRVVISACSPRMHERTWRAMLSDVGLNPYLLEVANLREHCSWAHPADEMTTQKAIDLVAAAVERVAWHDPLYPQRVPVTKAAMVVGGGVAGIQASLDIARAGVPVYLVERDPSIGGHMAQLDKTFPTLDCSACILTPKMVDAGNHPNITLLTYSEVEKVDGFIGNFTVTVRKKARYVDVDACTGCADCTAVCPVHVPSEFEQGLAERTAIYRPFAQAVPNAFAIDKRGISPCQNACPAGIHVQGYVALIAEGRFREAYDLIREQMPFPGVCGRVCHHPCEVACRRGEKDSAVAIEYLKRFVADWVAAHPEAESPPKAREAPPKTSLAGRRVAIVGAGPAGLTVARDLAEHGAQCEVFEALPVAGGMMAVGIPRYRLPGDTLQREIDDIAGLPGVQIHLGTSVQMDGDANQDGVTLAGLRRDYEAVFVGVGTHGSMRMHIPGESLGGVLHGAQYLRQLSLAQLGAQGVSMPQIGRRVVIVGGGNVAIDSAMTARRIGAQEVTILYRRTRAEMPANDWEVEEAEEEGIQFHFLATPIEIIGRGDFVAAVRCQRMRLGEPDESGRRRPVPIEGDTFDLPVDTVIMAIGQTLDDAISDVSRTRRGWIAADPLTLQTSASGVFAGGDAVSGPASVVEAVGAGHRAAESIRRFLLGEDLAEARKGPEPVDTSEFDYYEPADWDPQPRLGMPHRPLSDRDGFDEVNLGFDEAMALAEAHRCLSCNVCSECMACVNVCGAGAIHHDAKDELVDIDVGAIVVATGFDTWDPSPMLEYGYGVYPEVYTGLEIERLSNASGPTSGEIVMRSGAKPKRVAIIHCVGSRDEHYQPYCSRICCMYSLKLAHLIEEKTGAEVFQFYMDMRSFGKGYEEFYERVQHEGVVMVRGRGAQVLPEGDRLIVRAEDTDLGRPVSLPVDMVVLATAVVPSKGAGELAQRLHVTRDKDGFFLEAHPKLRPVDSNTDGLYLAGACQAPRDIPDTVAHAGAAAAQALGLLTQDYVEVVPTVAEVRTMHCVGCGLCVDVCPYGAPSLVENRGRMVAEINEALCKGCGLCVAGCRGKAISLRGFTDTQILTQLEALLQLEWA
ncbi:MAG: FAD-dependent oxidoreductase [Anaerolineae bacterium]|nr:FAD-dependent oxidoreductase [Anaerolineae bacterium]